MRIRADPDPDPKPWYEQYMHALHVNVYLHFTLSNRAMVASLCCDRGREGGLHRPLPRRAQREEHCRCYTQVRNDVASKSPT